MNFIEWSPQIALGIDVVDEQHRSLIEMVNRLSRRIHKMDDRAAAAEAARAMLEYADRHFADEEKLMRDCGYPGLEQHIKEHRKFIDKSREMGEVCLAADNAECMDLFNFLAHWILEHIMGTDRMYVSCVKKLEGMGTVKG